MNSYYQPSGKFSILSFLGFLLAAMLVFPILGLAYAYAIWYIPFIYLNFGLVLGLGAAVGWVLAYAAVKMGKVRNPMLATVLGIAGGLVALYFQVWLDLVMNIGESYGTGRLGITVSNIKIVQVFTLVTRPDMMWQIMGEVYNTGTWGIAGSSASGIFLGIVWVLEAVGVLAMSAFFPRLAAGKPYDESSDAWMNEVTLSICNYIENPAELVAELEKGNYQGLQALAFVANAEENHSVLTVFHADHSDYFLSIENKLAETDGNGKKSLNGTEFLQYLSINNTAGMMLLNKTA
jgi:hypothetical protein